MPTFIDESGDPGGGAGASPFFRLCAVTVPTATLAAAIQSAVRRVKKDFRLPATYEFKYSASGIHPDRRMAFFRSVAGFDWNFATASIEKGRLPLDQRTPQGCQWLATTALAIILRPVYLSQFDSDPASYRKERVTVDDNRDGKFLDLVTAQFRALGKCEQPERYLVGRVAFRDSTTDEVLQLADMVCGAVGAHLDGDSTWYDLLKSRDLATWEFPNRPVLQTTSGRD